MVRETILGRVLGNLALQCAAAPRRAVILITLSTLVVGAGMFQLETNSDLLKILPKDNPTTIAAQNASQEFRGFYDFVYVYYDIDPQKCEAAQAQIPYSFSQIGCDDIRSEAYVRGMDELWSFAQEEIPFAEYAIDLANIVKVINYTNSGIANDDPAGTLSTFLQDAQSNNDPNPVKPRIAAFSMPGTDPIGSAQFEGAWQGANAADDSVNDAIAPTFDAGRTLLFFDTDTHDVGRVELGQAVYAMVDAYTAEVAACDDELIETPCNLTWNVFDAEAGMPVRGVSALDAHASEVTQRDIAKLAPFIVWAIILILYLAFRDARVLLVSAANLMIAFVWTAGLMGWMDIPFSALNMTIVPLILGVGIDYGIHMVSEYLEHTSDGMPNDQAFREAGERAGIAMAIATITTAAGLLLMVMSPSVLMAQLGVVASLALVVTFLFTMTLIPSLLTLMGRPRRLRKHKGSQLFVNLARAVGKNKAISVVIILTISIGALFTVQDLEPEPFGNPELNYPEGDRVRDDSQHISDVFFGGETDTVNNFLVIEGDLTEPASHQFLDTLELKMETHPDIEGYSVTTLTRLVRAWKAVEQGTPDAVVNQFILANSGQRELEDLEYPTTQEEIRQTFDDIFASPFANFMTILLKEGSYDLGALTYDTNGHETYADIERFWAATWTNIYAAQQEIYGLDQRDDGYDGPQVHPFGNNAFSYLFIEEQLPWVNYVAALAFFLVVAMIAFLTRNVRASACTAVVMGLTSLWWMGTLPLLGVGLSVGLMLPLVFIMAIGSDDAIHLIWNMESTGQRERVYRFVGKAVTLTTVTTLAAFAIFSIQTDLLVRRTLLATAVAVAVMWLATVLVVPIFYPLEQKAEATRRPPRPAATQSVSEEAPVLA